LREINLGIGNDENFPVPALLKAKVTWLKYKKRIKNEKRSILKIHKSKFI
tara:strand:+ start:775 stop:924 length:150 start_codon:yes stop_codon:yes gene_type:complete